MNNKTFWDAMQDLSPALFKTYAAINKLADNETGYCFATNESIALKLNKHEKSISRDISDLIEKGYLFTNVIKSGFKVVERRLYTAENIKTYMIDKKNIDNLIKTQIKIEGDLTYYFNEKNTPLASNKNVTGKIAGNNFEDCTGNKNEERAGNKFVTVTNTNNTITNSTTTENKPSEKISSSSFLDNFLDLATKQNILSIKPEITETEFLEIYEKCKLEVKQGYAKNLNAILVQAIKGFWSFQAKPEAIKTVLSNDEKGIAREFDYYLAFYESYKDYHSKEDVINKFINSCGKFEKSLVDKYAAKLKTILKEVV